LTQRLRVNSRNREMDTVSGAGSCIVTLVERASGYVLIDKLRAQHFSISAQSAAVK
jgi:IS30 family transposase